METGRRAMSGMDPHHTDASVRNGRRRKKDDRLSLSRIVGMFIASVTVSVITTKLTSYLGSIIIVGLSSVLLAVFNALYERFFKASRKAAAKAILNMPHNDALPDKVAGHLQEIVIEDTETTLTGIPPVIDPETAPAKAGDAEPEPDDQAGHEDADDTPSADDDGDDTDDGATTDDGEAGRWRVRNLFESMGPVMKTIIVILLFALTTSLISWGVATVVEKPDVTNVTVKESKVEKLSQEEKDAIKSAAAAEVSNQIKQAQNSADAANGSTSDLNKRVASLEKQTAEMQNTIDSIQRQGSGQQSAPTSDINTLKQQLAQMQEELNALKTQQPSPSPSNRYGSGGTMSNGNGNH